MDASFLYVGELAALATACCWAVTSLAFEAAGRRVGSLPVNLIRLALAAVLLSGFTWITRGQLVPMDATGHTWFWLSLSGVAGFLIGDLCLFRAFVVIGARVSMLLMTLVPLLTTILGFVIMGETLTMQQLAGMTLTIAGVGSVVSERRRGASGRLERLPVAGILLGLGGAVGQALGLVLAKFGMDGYNAFAATHIRVLAGLVGLALVFGLAGLWPRIGKAVRDRRAMASIGVGSFFGPFLGVSLSLLAVQNTQAGVAATLMSITPVLIIPISVLVLKEHVSWSAAVGAGVAVCGSALMFL